MALYISPGLASDAEVAAAVSVEAVARAAADLLKQDAATAATDVELAAAVSTLNAAIAAKQDSATAATDTELTAAVASLTTAIGLKQDASTAATDAELTAGLALKQDASTAATDTELAAAIDLVRTRITFGGGEETLALRDASTSRSMAAGVMKAVLFRAQETRTINSLVTSNVTAGVGMTLCRMAVYSVDTSDFSLSGTLATTTNDTALWATASTEYPPKALSVPFNKVAGTWYAIGLLQVGGGTAPTIPCMLAALTVFAGATNGRARKVGLVSGLTDLPASVAAGSLSNDAGIPYVLMIP